MVLTYRGLPRRQRRCRGAVPEPLHSNAPEIVSMMAIEKAGDCFAHELVTWRPDSKCLGHHLSAAQNNKCGSALICVPPFLAPMAKFFPELTPAHQTFIAAQKIFFVASAPANGRVNLSPKGMDTFRIRSTRSVTYLDATGSGNETAAHLVENGRVTVMFCALAGPPLVLRLYGHGRAIHPRDENWATLRPLFGPTIPGERQIITLDVESVQTSCGFGVPRFDYVEDRDQLNRWAEKKGPDGIEEYWAEKNQQSIDGLPTGLLRS